MAVAEAGTTSAPHEPSGGRPHFARAAAARSEQLYARHHRMVAGLCRALLRDPGEAEDATQQVFLSAHRSLLNGAAPRQTAAWLATIARNECWARIRGRMREPLTSEAADDVAGTDDPVAEAIRRADLAALWRAIRALPKQQREALLLREFGGLRYDELAAALAVSEPAIESLLFRARTRLRAQLQSAAASLAPVARLIASGGGPAVAAKAAALGLGAAAVTGTAVVAPEMLDHRAHHARLSSSHALRTVRETAPIAFLQMPPAPAVHHLVVERVAATTTEPEPQRHEGGGTATESERRDGGAVTTTESERHDGGGVTTTATEQHDGGATTTTSSGDGGRSSGSASSGPGSGSGSGDGHDQTATTTTTTTTTTATTSVLPTVTIPDVEHSGVGGSGG